MTSPTTTPTTATATTTRPAPSRRRAAYAAALLMTAPAVAMIALGTTGGIESPVGELSDPGAAVRWGLPLALGFRDVAAALTIGALVLAAVVLPPRPGGDSERLEGARARAVLVGGLAAAAWAVVGLVVLVLTYADLSGISPWEPGAGGATVEFVQSFDLGRAHAGGIVLAALVAVGAIAAQRTSAAGVLAVLAIAATVPTALLGHSAGAELHGAAVDLQFLHLLGGGVWVGGLAALVVVRRALGTDLAAVLARYSVLATWCYALIVLSGLGALFVRLDGSADLGATYGSLIVVKIGLAVGIGLLGRTLRDVLVSRAASGQLSGVFVRLAVTELALMAMAFGIAVALSRTSPTQPGVIEEAAPTVAESILGFALPGPPEGSAWLTTWRPDVLWAVLAVAAVGWYLRAAGKLRRRGDAWPIRRAVVWVAGWSLLVYATSGPPGVYGRFLFSLHMLQHMTIGMVVPLLLVHGAPVTLALRTLAPRVDGSRGAREWVLALTHNRVLGVLASPLVAAVNFAGSLVVFYYSPLFELAMRTHLGHLLMTAHFLIVGYVFCWVICGSDPGPARPPHIYRLLLLLVTFAFHAFFGLAMMSGSEVLAASWFSQFPRDWGAGLLDDQQNGGGIAWALGDIPIAFLMLSMARSWLREDQSAARRYDRQADRDGGAELEAYNEMLDRLSRGRT